jgi:hypothetical protein
MTLTATAPVTAPATAPGPWRGAALLAGPAAVLSTVLVFAAAAAEHGDDVAMATSGLGIASGVAALATMVCLAFALAGLLVRVPALRSGFGIFAWSLAMIGTVLAAGAEWQQAFVQAGIAHAAPDVYHRGLPALQAGYVLSLLVLGVGWLLVAVALLRAQATRVAGWLLIVTGVLCIAPLPNRFLPLAILVSVVAGGRLRN